MTIGLKEYQEALSIAATTHGLHEAYLRLRSLIPGAFETPHAPTAEQVWTTTEDALKSYIAQYKALAEKHERLRDRLRQALEEEENR